MKNYIDTYRLWMTDNFFDSDTQSELCSLDDEEIRDRFSAELEFGTGGLRGKMGAGTNRMNIYTIARATLGLAHYLKKVYTAEQCRTRGVAVAYDTRLNSHEFADKVADVLSSEGIRVYLHKNPVPTPQLSFSVGHFGALAGIVITASHNPKQYNGYKVYNDKGCQLVPQEAKEVLAEIDKITDYRTLHQRCNSLIQPVDNTHEFCGEVLRQSRFDDKTAKGALKIVYTPLHGTGLVPLTSVLKADGFENVTCVQPQTIPDGNFPTVVSPNPEDKRALEMGIALAEEMDADIVLGTDPDSDRVGIAVKTEEGYRLISGNCIGALLTDFVLNNTELSGLNNPAIVKTVVTSELGADIARAKGVRVFNTLTGFKYIGEKITQFEQKGDFTFLFGYEESYGYLCGTHARDKDAVVSALLICEVAAYHKKNGKTLYDRLNELYDTYGYFLDALDSFTLEGISGSEKIRGMMKILRSESIFDGAQITDYLKDVPAEEGFGLLPKSDVVKFTLNDGSWLAVRPSGTEPKIKIYYSIKEKNRPLAEVRLEGIRKRITGILGL